jgi:hypothetical protein
MSGAIAWAEGNWTRRPGLAMGFAEHGGMWSDLVLLSMANAVIVPHLTWGPWLLGALLISAVASAWVHRHWYQPRSLTEDAASSNHVSAGSDQQNGAQPSLMAAGSTDHGDHMWPSHVHGAWWRDLSWSGWAHVLYVTGELSLVAGFLIHAMPAEVVLLVAAIFTIHVPIGLLQPRWYRTGHIATVAEQPLLAPLLLGLWAATIVKL